MSSTCPSITTYHGTMHITFSLRKNTADLTTFIKLLLVVVYIDQALRKIFVFQSDCKESGNFANLW